MVVTDYKFIDLSSIPFLDRIVCGDCLSLMKEMPDGCIDLCLTDPPYGISRPGKIMRDYRVKVGGYPISYDHGEWDYDFDPEPYLVEIKRLLNPVGSIIVWTSEQLFGRYREWFARNLYPRQALVWVKENPLPRPNEAGYRQATELLFWATKSRTLRNNPNFIFLGQDQMVNVFYAPIVGGSERTIHPTQKPLSVTIALIKRHCREGGVVFDPFAGVGTTLVAAKLLGRHYIGFELSSEYCRIAEQRLNSQGNFEWRDDGR